MSRKMGRREAIKIISASGLAVYLAPRFDSAAWGSTNAQISDISPINRSLGELAPRMWFADYPDDSHKILWDKNAYIASLGAKAPKNPERVPLVVIGGGISGLVSAYLLRDRKPVILEQAPRFGGNSKGQGWHGIDYSIGAAYFVSPEEGSDIDRLVRELNLDATWTIKAEDDPIAINGKIYPEFWNGETVGDDAAAKNQIVLLKEYFGKVLAGEDIVYPDIPITDPEILDYVKELDRVTFRAHLEKVVGGPLHSSVEAVIEQYCWSSLGASCTEISAAAGLNFYSAEFGDLIIMPGGNAAVAERLVERLASTLPPKSLRPDSLVYDVTVTADGVLISYKDSGGNASSILAQSVVMACPKFVVGRILSDIEPERLAAIKRLRYHSYLVANICIQGGGKAPFYDLYMLGDGKVDLSNPRKTATERKVTDVIYANYARPVAGSTVLTLYRALPYFGSRAEVLAPDSYARYRAEFEAQLKSSILPLLKIKEENIKDIRIARWGHPLPIAEPGLIADGVVDQLRKPFKDRIFFVEQDNWALPAFETAVTEAQIWAPEIEKSLQPKEAPTPTPEEVRTGE